MIQNHVCDSKSRGMIQNHVCDSKSRGMIQNHVYDSQVFSLVAHVYDFDSLVAHVYDSERFRITCMIQNHGLEKACASVDFKSQDVIFQSSGCTETLHNHTESAQK